MPRAPNPVRGDDPGMCLRSRLHTAVEEILPRSCAFCGALRSAREGNLCSGCFDDLPWIDSACPSVSSPLDYSITPLSYDFPVDVAIKAFKFERKLYYVPAFAEILRVACEQLPGDIDAVLPVPLHWRRKLMRGFNQAMELARPVAAHLGVPIARNVYRRTATDFQSGLAADGRERNLRRAFAVRRPLIHTHLLIVDDVITTGATARSLARVVLAAGVTRVSVLALAGAT